MLAKPGSEEDAICSPRSRPSWPKDATWYSRKARQIIGVTEETTTGVHRLKEMSAKGHAAVPRHQRQRLGHQVEVRQPLRLPRIAGRRHQARHRRDGGRQDRRGGRLRRRGQGQRAGAARCRRQVWVTEIDPINALQAAMEGLPRRDDGLGLPTRPTSSSPPPATRTIITTHMAAMKDNAIVCNIGHFDNEIDIASLEKYPVGRDQAAGRPRDLPRTASTHHHAGQGPAGEPGLRHRHPSYVMSSSSFANQTIAQIELFTHTPTTWARSTCCPSTSTKVARLQLKTLNAQLTELTDEQAAYIGVPKQGPYKARHLPLPSERQCAPTSCSCSRSRAFVSARGHRAGERCAGACAARQGWRRRKAGDETAGAEAAGRRDAGCAGCRPRRPQARRARWRRRSA